MISLADLVVIVAVAAGSALLVAAIGAATLRRLRTRSLATSVIAVVCTALAAVVAGAVATAELMFLSGHDLRVLLVVVAVAAAVGLTCAVLLGRAVGRSSRALADAAGGLEHGTYAGPTIPLAAELAALDRQLTVASGRLEASRERERALEASRRELVAWVSHDLRTPLAGIRAMAEALADGVVDDPATVARYHAGLRTEADRLTAMVDDLFELSKIHASALRLTMAEVSLADVLSDAVASAAPVAARKGVRLVGAAQPDLPAVQGSVPELGRVLRNVLSNAIRHTPADGTVHVRAYGDDGSAWVAVADACGGIPADDLPRVFDVAFRGTASRTPGEDGGAGLGLAVARGLVQAHHGEITIANDGPGCRVLVRLPAG